MTTFYMPLFFIISGMFFRPSNMLGKIKRLMIPYIFFYLVACSLYILRTVLRHQIVDWDYLLVPFLGGTKNYLNTPIWFLLVLSEIIILSYTICKHLDYKKGIIIAFLLGYVGCYFGKLTLHIPYYIDVALVNMPFFIISYYFKDLLFEKANTSLGIFLLFISIIIYCTCPGFTNVSQNYLPMGYCNFFIISVMASVGVIFVMKINFGHIGHVLSFLGKNSLIIMSTHMMLMAIPSQIIKIISITEIVLFVSLCLIMLLEIPIVYVCNKYLKFVLFPK